MRFIVTFACLALMSCVARVAVAEPATVRVAIGEVVDGVAVPRCAPSVTIDGAARRT